MKYKPDKFDRYAVKIVGIVLSIIFVGLFFLITLVRFKSPDENIFSQDNITTALGFIAIIVIGGYIYAVSSADKDKKEKDED